MKKKKISKDELSIDNETSDRHKWVLGTTWEKIIMYSERVDTCKLCECKRHMISFTVNGKRYTEVSRYERSGVHLPAKPAPACWGATNPK